MSHVDEGQLHAYLDGGLSAMDAVRIERHLAECAPCRQRLEEARALVHRAAKLLEWANPPERAAPLLGDLRRIAPRWRTPVAWAATIVVALGIGIYGGQRLLNGSGAETPQTLGSDSRESKARLVTAPPIVASLDSNRDALRDAERPTGAPQSQTAATPAPPPQTPAARGDTVTAALGALANRAEVDSVGQRVDSVGQRTKDSLAVVAAVVARGAARATQPVADSLALRERRQQLAPAAAEAAPPVPIDRGVTTGAAPQLNRMFAYRNTTSWPVITRDSASRLLRGPIVALPDFPITAVRASNDAIVVEHVLPPGQVIRLVERRAQADETAAGRANEALARYIGGLRVEITGPFTADSLSRLLDRVRVMP